MKYFFEKEISNWRLFFIIITFILIAAIIMKDSLELDEQTIQYLRYGLYAGVALGYADPAYKYFKRPDSKRNRNSDVIDNITED